MKTILTLLPLFASALLVAACGGAPQENDAQTTDQALTSVPVPQGCSRADSPSGATSIACNPSNPTGTYVAQVFLTQGPEIGWSDARTVRHTQNVGLFIIDVTSNGAMVRVCSSVQVFDFATGTYHEQRACTLPIVKS